MFAAILGCIVLFNLLLMLALSIGAALQGDWQPLIGFGQGVGAIVGVIALLCVPGIIMDMIRGGKRELADD